ncbi:hypothetical protein ES319_A03G181600v1 [Gossypium barbadense]|uniref:Uncharacterized protein n=1 Tax=Gossypium barbadense TaxID=3634 RepID=A0A5J5WGJ9_GOSBA|nr:hypothetical protein ES319_A03G181600v1 [Gossypium barbadense]KAB2091286.1 hypothetical protein ES319_A03G181600v1 [Gossypium barbadense]KAB2091287.1 hypothetical protein ES319_A03G181600v1 [Gossypium barbadense]
MSSRRKKNKELASDNSPEEKRRRHQGTSDTDVASTSKKHRKPKIKYKLKELIDEKPVETIVKVLKDRIDRKMKNDKMADMESVILVVRTMMANNASHLLPEVLGSLKQIKKQWPVRSDIQTEKQNLQLIKKSYKDKVLTEEEAKNELFAVGMKIEGLDEQRLKDLTNTDNLNAIFSGSMEFSVETLKTKFFSAFPWLRESTEINSHVIPVDQDHRNLPTRETLLSNFSTETNGLVSPVDQGNGGFVSFEVLRSNLCNLISQLYDENNKEVGISDYDGLQLALKDTGWGRPPDYLEPVATRIEKARGEPTADIHKVSLLLVCAAVKEMEELTLEYSKWDMLKKWAATLNVAKKSGFIVEFADNLLLTKLFAYFSFFPTHVEWD